MADRYAAFLRIAAVLALAFCAPAAATAATPTTFPARPIKLVVPYPPGALTDLLARAIGQRLAVALKQPVVIDNKPGEGTLVGAGLVAKAPPDGYTLLMATSTTLGISPLLYHSSPIDPVKDFAPISRVGSVNFFLVANPEFPARNMKEMLDAIRRAPGKYNYASVGSGSPHHLFMEVLKSECGLDIHHIPYKGTPAAFTDLLAHRVDVMFVDATAAVPNIRAGKVIALGTSAGQPTTLLPSVVPIAATVPGFDWQAWQGIVAPAGTPKEVIDRLWSALQTIQQTPEFRQELFKFGMEPFAPQTPAEFAATIKGEQPRWAAVIKSSGARVD